MAACYLEMNTDEIPIQHLILKEIPYMIEYLK